MGRIVSFFGADTQVGTTMVAQSTAEQLGQEGHRVLLVLLSEILAGDYIIQNNVVPLDQTWLYIEGTEVDFGNLKELIVKTKSFDVIYGPVKIEIQEMLKPEDFKLLTQACKDDYDFLIIDGGSQVNKGLALGSLLFSDENYFILTQQEKSIRRFKKTIEQAVMPLSIKGKIIINKYVYPSGISSPQELETSFGFKCAGLVPYTGYGWQAEREKRTMMHIFAFRVAIKKLCEGVLGVN